MTLRITLHIFRTTFPLFIDAVPLTMAAYKSLFTSRRCVAILVMCNMYLLDNTD
jgi:hypothetical protein